MSSEADDLLSPVGVRRREARRRPSKSLPTDRMKFEVQLRVLQTMGRLSGQTQRAIDAQHLSAAMKGEVSHYTVLLSHGFFLDAGWVEKRGRGEYSASEALLDYTRRASTGADKSRAVEALREAARRSWFWQLIEPQLGHGRAPMGEILVCLMQEAEVGDAHLPQLRTLLEWLRYVELVELDEDEVSLLQPHQSAASSPRSTAAEVEEGGTEVPQVQDVRTTPPTHSTAARVSAAPTSPGVVLALDVSMRLTAEDLSQLAPEQIQALFQAVGTVLAIKNAQ